MSHEVLCRNEIFRRSPLSGVLDGFVYTLSYDIYVFGFVIQRLGLQLKLEAKIQLFWDMLSAWK